MSGERFAVFFDSWISNSLSKDVYPIAEAQNSRESLKMPQTENVNIAQKAGAETSDSVYAENQRVIKSSISSTEDAYSDPQPCGKGKDYIIKLAQEIAAEGYDPEKKLSPFLTNFGGKLIEQSTEIPPRFGFARSCILVQREGEFAIHSRELTERKGLLFDIAHEFGHYILHYILPLAEGIEIPEKMAAGRLAAKTDIEKAVEREANIFAISFLLPKKKFIEQRELTKKDALLMTNYFNVSRSTIKSYGGYLGYKDFVNLEDESE